MAVKTAILIRILNLGLILSKTYKIANPNGENQGFKVNCTIAYEFLA